MVAALVFFIVFDVDSFAAVVFFFLIVANILVLLIVVVIRLKSATRFKAAFGLSSLGSKASASLSHLVEEVVTFTSTLSCSFVLIVIEDLFVFGPLLVLLEILNNLLIFLSAFDLLQIVLV
jgi:hypothetical protein